MFAKERLFHNADKSKLVRQDSEDAAFLYANVGDEIPESAAELYGLEDGALPGFAELQKEEEAELINDDDDKGAGTGDAAASPPDPDAGKADAGKADAGKADAAKVADEKAAAKSENKAGKPGENKGK